ncbi:MAG: hypothetical protein V1926_01560 [Candidatus Peregrinibacteria bacterium]
MPETLTDIPPPRLPMLPAPGTYRGLHRLLNTILNGPFALWRAHTAEHNEPAFTAFLDTERTLLRTLSAHTEEDLDERLSPEDSAGVRALFSHLNIQGPSPLQRWTTTFGRRALEHAAV